MRQMPQQGGMGQMPQQGGMNRMPGMNQAPGQGMDFAGMDARFPFQFGFFR